jgi:hyaluronoglucosaminidase
VTTATPQPSATASRPSPFAVRGVIEGFYGNPWTHEQRLELISFLAAHGMDTFVYGPKDDPLTRRDWRVPYTGSDLARMRELVDRCREHGIRPVYCLSPGLSIRYSDPADLGALVAKFETLGAIGVRDVALLLDDIPRELQHAADRAAFADLIEAQIALIGAVAAHFGPDRGLAVCPTVYWGVGDERDIARLGRGIDRRIDLYWTGRAICSARLDLADAEAFTRATGRPPTYWDNYPVNDVAMTHELHIGPYRGRDPQLARSTRGVIANGMELFEASKIPIATIADYLADPEGYDPETSWARAIREVAGEHDAEAFATFADNVRSSCLSVEDAPVVTRALERFAFRVEEGEGVDAARELASLADTLLAAAEHLLRGPLANPGLVDESRPWIEAFEIGARTMRRMADLAADGRLARDAQAELRPALIELRQRRVRVFGDALDMTLADLTDTHPRPGDVTMLRAGGGGTP